MESFGTGFWWVGILSLTAQWDFQVCQYWSLIVLVFLEAWRVKAILNKIISFIPDSLITCKPVPAYHCMFQIRCQSKQGRLRSSVTQKKRSILVSHLTCIKKLRKWSFTWTDFFFFLLLCCYRMRYRNIAKNTVGCSNFGKCLFFQKAIKSKAVASCKLCLVRTSCHSLNFLKTAVPECCILVLVKCSTGLFLSVQLPHSFRVNYSHVSVRTSFLVSLHSLSMSEGIFSYSDSTE